MNTNLEILRAYTRQFDCCGHDSASNQEMTEILMDIVAEMNDPQRYDIDGAREYLVGHAQRLDLPVDEYVSAIAAVVTYTGQSALAAEFEIERVLRTFHELRTGQPA